jgi:ComF family protein
MLRPYFAAFLDLLFPRYCLACHGGLVSGEEIICTACRHGLPRTDSHRYPNETLQLKLAGRVPLASLQAYLIFTKGGKVQRLLHALKYKGHQEVGELLGRWYGAELTEVGFPEKIDLILPVPLHKKKRKVRGYNQSDCFAKGLSEGLGVAWSAEIVKKGKPTESQTRKTRLERLQNVQDVFFVENREAVRGKRIALVDDVITTGATLEACATALLEAGCREVHLITIATAT